MHNCWKFDTGSELILWVLRILAIVNMTVSSDFGNYLEIMCLVGKVY